MDQAQGIRGLAGPIASSAGLEVWDVEVGPGMVRVLLDRAAPGNGVDLDTLAGVTRALSGALDGHEELAPAGRYHLEVSSPGLERRLRTPDHYRRSVGVQVSVKLRAGAEPWPGCPRRLTATLVAADDTAVTLEAGDVAEEAFTVPYELIDRTRTVLDWGPQPKPGRPPAGAPRRGQPARRPSPRRQDNPQRQQTSPPTAAPVAASGPPGPETGAAPKAKDAT